RLYARSGDFLRLLSESPKPTVLRGVRQLFPEQPQVVRRAYAAAALAFREVHRLVGELHEGGVIGGVERACRDAHAQADAEVLGQDVVYHGDALDELIAALERRFAREVREYDDELIATVAADELR